MEPPRENSPSTPSRYLNSYLQQTPTELFHQNFPQRQMSNQQFYAADNLSTNNKNYLKRHHQNYEKNDSERDKKYDSKKIDEQNLHQTQQQAGYDGFNNDSYSASSISTSTGSSVSSANTTQPQKAGANTKSLTNGKKTKGRVKIKMEYIDNKLRRYTTFSKRKTGIMKKVSKLLLFALFFFFLKFIFN
jgi:SRF-type transcription factor (DNA-binding and dimerisation domain)